MSDIIVTVDLGTFIAFEIIRDPMKLDSDRLETIKNDVIAEPRAKAAEKFSDAAGRFYQGGGTGGTGAGFGEPHNVERETEKRMIKRIAEDISQLIAEKDCDTWFLAADKSINNQLLECLAPAVKAKLKKNVAANLTKASKLEITGYFAERRKKIA